MRMSPRAETEETESPTTSAFDLPDRLAGRADPALIAGEERHFVAIATSLEHTTADLAGRLYVARKAPAAPARRHSTET